MTTLFEIRLEPIEAGLPGVMATPFGEFLTFFDALGGDTRSARPTDARGDGQRWWFRWEWDDFDVELLHGPIRPKLPPQGRVDGCVAAPVALGRKAHFTREEATLAVAVASEKTAAPLVRLA